MSVLRSRVTSEVETHSVSVAMATYNGETHLRAQLESLATQSLLPEELVVSDDGSSDDTLGIVAEFARSAPFEVRFWRNEMRLGFRKNFLKAAGECRSTLIALCDQDDIWRRDKLGMTARCFDDKSVQLAHHDSTIIDSFGAELGRLRSFAIPALSRRHETDPWFTAYGNTMVFRRGLTAFSDLWEQSISAHSSEETILAGFGERKSHDHWIFLFATECGKVAYVDEPLIFYRQHANNAEGWGGRTSYFQRWRHRLERREKIYQRCADSASARADILAIAASRSAQKQACEFTRGSSRYRLLAQLYESRARLYRSKYAPERLQIFAALLRDHAYDGHGAWTFHFKGGIKDAVLGALFGPLTARYGVPAKGSDPTCSAVRGKS